MRVAVAFPVGKETEAESYRTFVNTNSPSGPFSGVAFDRHGQQIVGYLGPGGFLWNGEPYPEPEGGEEARADGVLVDHVEWPEDPPIE